MYNYMNYSKNIPYLGSKYLCEPERGIVKDRDGIHTFLIT